MPLTFIVKDEGTSDPEFPRFRKAALRFDASDEWSFFLSYSQAYRAGGVSVDSSNGEVFPFDPEYTDY